MKKYVLIVFSICNMGGAEQYYNNKSRRLRNAGYDVVIFSTNRGNVVLSELKPYYSYLLPLLRFPPSIVRKREVEKTVDTMVQAIGDCSDGVYIECTELVRGEWGELLAKRLNCQNMIFDLQEQHNYSLAERDFLSYKYKRKELYGINAISIEQILKNDIPESIKYDSVISAECTNVVQEVEYESCRLLPLADFTIGSIGRLDKLFVQPFINSIVDYSNKYPEKRINLILIGGSNEKVIKEIKTVVDKAGNIQLHITGYIYPIPLELIRKIDCFVSSAGSSRVSMKLGIPTVSMSADDGSPIGILNYTTRNTLYKGDDEETHTLDYYLDKILFQNYCQTHNTLGMEIEADGFDAEKEFMRQLDFFNTQMTKDYYDVMNIAPSTIKMKIMAILNKCFTAKVIERIQYACYSIKKRVMATR